MANYKFVIDVRYYTNKNKYCYTNHLIEIFSKKTEIWNSLPNKRNS